MPPPATDPDRISPRSRAPASSEGAYLAPMEVQVFGVQNDADTRKALRFFKERRIGVHFVDLKQRAAAPRELERFARKYGPEALLDRDSREFRNRGLHVAHLPESRILPLLADDPSLLRTPLVRYGNEVTVGLAEEEWKGWQF